MTHSERRNNGFVAWIFFDAQGVRIGTIIAAVYDIVTCAIWWLL